MAVTTYELEIGARLCTFLQAALYLGVAGWLLYGLYGAWLVVRHDNLTRGRR